MGVAIKIPLPGMRRKTRESEAGSDARGRQPLARHAPGRNRPLESDKRSRTVRPGDRHSKGATRTVRQAAKQPWRGTAWLNRSLILLGVGVVLAVGMQGWIKLQSIPVERITVTGELEHTRTSAVSDMVQPALDGGFLGTDLSKVRAQLEALPWIYRASVRRVWPNALEIHVVEQLPIARWGETSFLNHEGQIFRPSNREAWQSLPLLRGPDGAAGELMRSYQRLVDLLTPLGLAVQQLEVDERGQLQAVLQGGQQLVIGGTEFLERMHRFGAVYRAELGARMADIERIDLRYERGVAVAFREEPAATESIKTNKKA